MPDDCSYIWNLKNQINKTYRNRLIDTENILMVAEWEGGWVDG